MQESDTTMKCIEGEINKLFSQPEEDTVDVATLLSKLELAPIRRLLEDRYAADEKDGRMKNRPMSVLKALMLKELKGIAHYSQLLGRMARHPEEAELLQFNIIMSKQSLCVFNTEKMTDEIKDLMMYAVDCIRENAKKTGKVLDIYFSDDDAPAMGRSKRSVERRKTQKSGEVVRVLKREVFPELDFPLRPKAKYEKVQFLDLMAYVAYEGVCANQGSMLMKDDANFTGRVPHARTLLGYLKLLDQREIELMFTNAFEKVFAMAKGRGFFNKEVDVAIDFTDWLYYGDKNDLGVMEGKPKDGTSHRFRFATVKIVEKSNDFVLLALPVFKMADRRETIRRLIEYAKSKVNVRYFYIDREFFSSTYISLFDEIGIAYIMPAIKNEKVARLVENRKSDLIPYSFTGSAKKYDAKMTLVVRKDEEDRDVVFATNVPILKVMWSNLFELYGKRWGIETGYRVAKHEFRPNTTSKDHRIRLYYFLFSSLMYNVWVIVNSIVSVYLFGEVSDDRVITAKMFMKKFYQAYMEDYG